MNQFNRKFYNGHFEILFLVLFFTCQVSYASMESCPEKGTRKRSFLPDIDQVTSYSSSLLLRVERSASPPRRSDAEIISKIIIDERMLELLAPWRRRSKVSAESYKLAFLHDQLLKHLQKKEEVNLLDKIKGLSIEQIDKLVQSILSSLEDLKVRKEVIARKIITVKIKIKEASPPSDGEWMYNLDALELDALEKKLLEQIVQIDLQNSLHKKLEEEKSARVSSQLPPVKGLVLPLLPQTHKSA